MNANAAPSPAQTHALRCLSLRNGEGAIDKQGIVVAAGERLNFDSVTWLRLITIGLVEAAGPLRIRMTQAGHEYVKSLDRGVYGGSGITGSRGKVSNG